MLKISDIRPLGLQKALRQVLVTDSARLLQYVMNRHPEVMEQLDPQIADAIQSALTSGSDACRKACIEYIHDRCFAVVATETVLDRQHVGWGELHAHDFRIAV